MNTSLRSRPLSRSAWPTSASLPYMVAVSRCRYPTCNAVRTASKPAEPRSRQVPNPSSGMLTPPGNAAEGISGAFVIGDILPS